MGLVDKFIKEAMAMEITQYAQPKNFELFGREFKFVFDEGTETGEATVNLSNDGWCYWSIKDGELTGKDWYECRKADDFTYLLTIGGYTKDIPKYNVTFVIDVQNGLVTMQLCTVGKNPKSRYIQDVTFAFGYIYHEGAEPPKTRHGYTDEPVGSAITWTYSTRHVYTHVYYDPDWYRIIWHKDSVPPVVTAENDPTKPKLATTSEPITMIKIKRDMFFLSITEKVMEQLLGPKAGMRCSNLCFLDSWTKMVGVGRAFGTASVATDDDTTENDQPILLAFTRYGKPAIVDRSYFTDPNPYLNLR